MENNKKFELNNDVLDKVAGGRTGMDFGTPEGQIDTVPVIHPPILVHPYPSSEEDESTNTTPGFVGRL